MCLLKTELQTLMTKRENQHSRRESLALLAIFLVVFIIWGGMWWWIDKNVQPTSVSETLAGARGAFGDKFGAINALFSGLAFAGLITTILLQRRELAETREAFERQVVNVDIQRFDSTFFQLVALHNDITAKLSVLGQDGRNAFFAFNEQLRQADNDFPAYLALSKLERPEVRNIIQTKTISADYKLKLLEADVANISESIAKDGTISCENYLDENQDMQEKKIEAAYTKAALVHIDNFSHYFRNLYHLLRFIKETSLINEDEKRRYAKILRSQLSEPELLALFYNSLCPIKLPGRETMELGFPKMGALLIDFDILQNLSPRSIFHPLHQSILKKNYTVGK